MEDAGYKSKPERGPKFHSLAEPSEKESLNRGPVASGPDGPHHPTAYLSRGIKGATKIGQKVVLKGRIKGITKRHDGSLSHDVELTHARAE